MALNSILTQLENEQLIRFTEEADMAYIFKNALSQQAAYQSLLSRNRRELHKCVAEVYEKLYAEQLDEIAVLLAQHYAQAGDGVKTFDYSVRAGNAAMRVYAIAEAIQHYSRAVEIVRTSSSPSSMGKGLSGEALREMYSNLGRAYELSGKYDDALGTYEEMETLGHARGDSTMELDAIIALATIRSTPTTLYDAILGRSLSDWGIQVAQKAGNREAEAKILWNLMNLCFFSMRPQEGIEYGERALAIARELGLTERLAYTLNDINRLYLAIGEMAQARKCVTEARELWRALNNLPMLADNYGSGAEVAQYSGNLDLAFTEAQQAVELAHSIENFWTLSYGLGLQASVLLERGEVGEAFRAGYASLEFAEQAGFAAGGAVGKSEMGLAFANLGEVARGIEMIQEVLDGPAGLLETFQPGILSFLARMYARSGRLTQAEETMNRVQIPLDHPFIYVSSPVRLAHIELAFVKKEYAIVIQLAEPMLAMNRQKGISFFHADALVLQARAYQALDQLDRAEEIFSEARAFTEAAKMRRVLWQAYLGLSRIAQARGNNAQAREWRDKARTVVTFIADHIHDEQLHGAFLNLPDVSEVLN